MTKSKKFDKEEFFKKCKFDHRITLPTCDVEPCKSCKHLKDVHLIKVDEWDIWVDTTDPKIQKKMTLNEYKQGFKCLYNGIESQDPMDLQKGFCECK